MMPGIGPRNDERKKRARTAAFIGGGAVMAYVVLSATRFRAWEWVPLAASLIIIIVIAVEGIAGRPGGRGRGSGLRGRGRDGDDGPAGAAAHRWRMLVMVSRMMPRSAGCRWLAEADSLLSEIACARYVGCASAEFSASLASTAARSRDTRSPCCSPAAPGSSDTSRKHAQPELKLQLPRHVGGSRQVLQPYFGRDPGVVA